MEFSKIDLKPMSWTILRELAKHKEPCKAEIIGQELGLSTRQVDAAVTKSLVRHGFCIRLAKLTRLMKKEYNELSITDKGMRYVKWRLEKETVKIEGE